MKEKSNNQARYAEAPEQKYHDFRTMRHLFRQMSRAFRDSMGGTVIERCEEISKLLFCKMFVERYVAQGKRITSNPFISMAGETNGDIYDRTLSLYADITSHYPRTFVNDHKHITDDKQAVANVIRLLRDAELSSIPMDVKGMAYEELLKNSFDKSENQQFFTPRNVIEFMVNLAAPPEDKLVCDPACGTGGFLIAVCRNHSLEAGKSPRIKGIEIDRRMAWIAQMNLFMHGVDDEEVFCIPLGGSLSFGKEAYSLFPDNEFDFILTNPPFGSDYTDTAQLMRYVTGRGKASRRRGVLFVERCIRALKAQGLLGIIIEDSVLSSDTSHDIREFILRYTNIEAIISLPNVTFMPYSTAKTSILFLRKKSNPGSLVDQGDVFMAIADNVGRRPNGDPEYKPQRDEMGKQVVLSDLPDICKSWHEFNVKGQLDNNRSNDRVFVCPKDRIVMCASGSSSNRLDTLYHHPMRYASEKTLKSSAFPVVRLGDIAIERIIPITPSQEIEDDVCRFIGLANIRPTTGEYTVTEMLGHDIKSIVKQFQPGDILFSKLRPELRKCCLISSEEDEGYASSECVVLSIAGHLEKMKSEKARSCAPYSLLPEYLAIILRSDLALGQLVYQITGIGRPRISRNVVMDLRIPIPPLNLQQQIVDSYKAAHENYLEAKEQSQLRIQVAEQGLLEALKNAIAFLCPA